MSIRRIVGAVVGAAVVAVTGIVATSPAAQAASRSPMGDTLCSATKECGIFVGLGTVNDGVREGTPFTVNVVGQKGKAIQIRAFAVKWVGDVWDYVPISAAASVTPTGSASAQSGMASVTLTITTPPAGVNAGQVYVQPADFKKGFAAVGTSETASGSQKAQVFTAFTSRGRDGGFAERTFNDYIFHRKLDAAVPGHRYSVQLLRGSKWVTIDNSGPGTVGSQGTTSVQARVPADLPSGKYRTRLVNLTRNLSDISPNENYTYFTWNKTPSPTDPGFNVYTTPGTWRYNGRDWKTACEKYSSTTRCRTEIFATQITYRSGKFYRSDAYVFNNLTYLPAPRSLWRNNPLGGNGKVGFKGEWTAQDGRRWRTECDTSTTGRNGCRSYIWATVAESAPGGYRLAKKWVFNNIVQFS